MSEQFWPKGQARADAKILLSATEALVDLAATDPAVDPKKIAAIIDSAKPPACESLFHAPEDFLNAPPLSFSIGGFLQNEGATMVGGLSGHAKTWLMLSIAKALFAGKGTRLWNLFPVNETAEKIIYLIPESSLGPFAHRLKLMGLLDYTQNGRLLVRTLSMGPPPYLDDPRLLAAASGAHLFLDTASRFIEGDEKEAKDVSKGLAADLFRLLHAQCRTITAAHHAPKNFARENTMSLENVLRGSGDLGAMLCTAWALKQIDPADNIIHIENVKARDFQPCAPFQLIGRPHIDTKGDFQLHRGPGECGTLEEEQRSPNNANLQKHSEKSDRLEMLRVWDKETPGTPSSEIVERYKANGIDVDGSTVRKYRAKIARELAKENSL